MFQADNNIRNTSNEDSKVPNVVAKDKGHEASGVSVMKFHAYNTKTNHEAKKSPSMDNDKKGETMIQLLK